MTSRAALAWGLLAAAAVAGGGLLACSSSEDPGTLSTGGSGGTTSATTTTTTTTGEGGEGQGGFNPNTGPCTGHAGDIVCEQGVAITCGPDEEELSQTDCGDQVCVPDSGCTLCIEGQFSCYGNELRSCSIGPPLEWTAVATCASTEHCNATAGICEPLTPIGNGPENPTGQYYQYANFNSSNTAFLSGYDVDSLGDHIYVNRGGQHLDVYKVELLDSDGDGEFEPNQHPDNPDKPGPIEERVLTHLHTYDTSLGDPSGAELFLTSDRAFFVNRSTHHGTIFEYLIGSGTTNTVVDSPTPVTLSVLAYDPINDLWYGAQDSSLRQVYSYHAPTDAWVAEFQYPNLAGSHMDGIEVVVDPNTDTPYVYVSDMTSDYLGQYVRDRGGEWKQVNLFEYFQSTNDYVEGMGFGAFNHFWATSGDALYEIGGGDLQKFTEPYVPPS